MGVEFKMGTLLGAILLLSINQALSLSCGGEPGSYPCETPVCCPSGELTLDSSGACQICAKGLHETCGGPWNIKGACARDLNCLRTCYCSASVKTKNRPETFETKDCIFPFNYKGKTYAKCTTDGTTNGKAWCATEIDDSGTVIEGKWGDCDDSCFENEQSCHENDFINEAGRCIRRNEIEPKLQLQIVRYKIDENEAFENNETNVCLEPRSQQKCECALTKIYGQAGEACEVLDSGTVGFCFLNNVQDIQNPTKNCYSDVDWNASAGKFYSKEACYDYVAIEPPPPPDYY